MSGACAGKESEGGVPVAEMGPRSAGQRARSRCSALRAGLERRLYELGQRQLQEHPEQPLLRRLEVDMSLPKDEESRLQRELDSMIAAGGFTGVNDPKEQGVLKNAYTYPLHAAVEANSVKAVNLLIGGKANVNQRDSQNQTALHLAILLNKHHSHLEVINILKDKQIKLLRKDDEARR